MPDNPPISKQKPSSPSILIESEGEESLVFRIEGRLDSDTSGETWRNAMDVFERSPAKKVIIDASGITYCDFSGLSLLLELNRRQKNNGGEFELRNLRDEFTELLALFDSQEFEATGKKKPQYISLPEGFGRATVTEWEDIRAIIVFVGEASMALFRACLNPRQIRWKEVVTVAESSGVNALPIVLLISFLIGLIMAFQAAIPMRQFGAEIYVANLIGLSMVRELGPLMTAILLTGRSGSAFAAELGTMKINEEVDALTTMGLDPVEFLVVTRLIAALFMIPLLTIFADLVGVMGGSIVLLTMGYSLVSYLNQVLESVNYIDLAGGLFKSIVFGLLVAGMGCLRGLQTKTGASSVGEATTSAVVGGIIIIVIADGIFSILFYYLGI